MPKQIIYSSDGAFLSTADGSEYSEGDPEAQAVLDTGLDEEARWYQRGVHVGWTKNHHVEIGVARFDPSRELASQGHFLSLDRKGCNDLIRAVKRARNAAFGADE